MTIKITNVDHRLIEGICKAVGVSTPENITLDYNTVADHCLSCEATVDQIIASSILFHVKHYGTPEDRAAMRKFNSQ